MGPLLENRTAVVTGAAGGIGRGIALELAREGAAVVVSDLASARPGTDETVAMIRAEGGTAEATDCDVTSPAAAAALVATARDRFGRLDCAVNNAGIATHKPLAEVSEEEYDRILGVNLRGVFLGMKAQIPALVEQGGGAIVNVASVAGLVAVPLISPYAASKFGVIGLTRTAAMEYGAQGVRVNAVCPNAIRTPLMDSSPPEFVAELLRPQAIKRVGEPEEVGFAVAYLCSARAAFLTGVALPVDGGYAA
jgi:NAD(P)-dependent dehydrogenase (short-subunit alcohol dehydrogenase family)